MAPALIPCLRAEDEWVPQQARRVLRGLLGVDLGTDARRWQIYLEWLQDREDNIRAETAADG